jgi:hypothetical protein
MSANRVYAFRTLDDLPLELISQSIASMSVEAFVARVTAAKPTPSKR